MTTGPTLVRPVERAAGAAGTSAAVWFGAMLLGAWALRLVVQASSGASLHVDEAQYWDWSRSLQWGYYSKPPGIAVLIALSTSLFGDGETGVRALAMACYPATAGVLALLAADMAPAPRRAAAACWTAAVFLAAPTAALLGLVATTDAPLLLSWSLAMSCLWFGVVRDRRGAWFVLALAIAAGLLSKYTFAALLIGAAGFVTLHGHPRHRAALALSLLAGLALCIPHLLWNAAHGWPTWRHTAEITVASAPRSGDAARRLAELVVGQLLVAGPIVLAAWLLQRRRQQTSGRGAGPEAMSLLAWCSLPLAAIGLVQAWRSGAEVNWLAPAHLALALAIGCSVAALDGDRRGPIRYAALAQAVLLTALALAPRAAELVGVAVPVWLDPWARMRGWAPAFARLEPVLTSMPAARVVGTSRTVLAQAAYHWRHLAPLRASLPAGAVAASHYELVCSWQGDGSPGGAPILVLSDGPLPDRMAEVVRDSTVVHELIRPGRVLELRLGTLVATSDAESPRRTSWCR